MDDLSRFSLIGSSSSFKEVIKQIRRLAGVGATVLITGESGTGKELAARAVHYLSDRNGSPFVPVNCGSLSDSLIESELFGHERGAFTDAKNAALGLIGEAAGGTLFLDEIDTLSLKAQASLLRFLQDRTYRRVGGGSLRHADVRIVAASNADLDNLSQARLFRLDLLYRLNVLTLHMPALRQRDDDALEMAQTFIARLSQQYRTPAKRLHPEAVAFMRDYSWPGNVRELENVIHRDFLMCEGEEITLHSLRLKQGHRSGLAAGPVGSRFKEAKARCVAEFERAYVRNMLSLAEGNLSAAARLAGKDRSAFGKLARKYASSVLSDKPESNEAPA
jgi:DNA-binding NtrC family response regulator